MPRDVLQLVAPVEGEAGQQLISHPDVERVVLTGAYETAQLFASWDPERPLTAAGEAEQIDVVDIHELLAESLGITVGGSRGAQR